LDLKEEQELGDIAKDHWYYRSKAKAMKSFLSNVIVPEVLDVGAGSGYFSKYLIEEGIAGAAVCVDPKYPNESDIEYHGGKIAFRKSVDGVTQQLILMMDVIEHVDDDIGLIREYSDCMASGSKVLITVPAFQWLWSDHDEFLEHRRRYSLPHLEHVVQESGLVIIKSRYFYASIFPAVVFVRLLQRVRRKIQRKRLSSDLKPQNVRINRVVNILLDVELKTLFAINKLFGVTVICYAEKH